MAAFPPSTPFIPAPATYHAPIHSQTIVFHFLPRLSASEVQMEFTLYGVVLASGMAFLDGHSLVNATRLESFKSLLVE